MRGLLGFLPKRPKPLPLLRTFARGAEAAVTVRDVDGEATTMRRVRMNHSPAALSPCAMAAGYPGWQTERQCSGKCKVRWCRYQEGGGGTLMLWGMRG